MVYDVIIIGGGPSGYTAALYCARAGLRTLVLEKMGPGGQMALTSHIDNYPGFPDGIDGFTLAQQMQKGAERFGAETRLAEVISLQPHGDVKAVETRDETLHSRVVILATGASPKELGVPGEEEMTGRGVSYCAECDGMFYKGKTVAVIGGGNTAAADALLLSRLCKKVVLVHRRDTLRATKVYHKPLETANNVEFRWNSTVSGLLYGENVTGVKVKDVLTGEETVLDCDGVFVSIGRKPASDLVKDTLPLDPGGYIIADETTQTAIPGVFAVGDVRTKHLRQIVTATADGAAACYYAEEYLARSTPDNTI